MADTCLMYFMSLLSFYKEFVSAESCKGCFIGTNWQSSPCSDCCCDRDIPTSENCCYKMSEDNLQKDRSPDGPFKYYLAVPFSILFLAIFLVCCLRNYDNKCSRLLFRRKPDAGNGGRSTTQSSTNCNLYGNDRPPPYENIQMEELQIAIIVPKSPPYIKDPPPYTEVLSDSTGVNDQLNTDAIQR